MERAPRDDPFIRPPWIPENWRIVRALVQALAGIALLLAPLVSYTLLVNELPLLAKVWRLATFGVAVLASATAAVVVGRWVSRVAGTLLAVGASIEFLAFLLVLSIELSEWDH